MEIEGKLTSLRKQILFILWTTNKPMKAYEILDNLLEIKTNSKPSTVYRVLDYFVECGVIHKIESIQSYTLCHEPKQHLSFEMLMLCNQCHQVKEVYDSTLYDLMQALSKKNHFKLGAHAIELSGCCETCFDRV